MAQTAYDAPDLADLRQGDYVKVRVAGERLWFEILARQETEAKSAGLVARLVTPSIDGAVFDGRVTIDPDWIVDTARAKRPNLKIVV